MVYDRQKSKTLARRIVQKTFAVLAFYQDNTMSSPQEITARYHDKLVQIGDLDSAGYAVTMEGADRVLFDAAMARQLNVQVGGEVWFQTVGGGMGVDLGAPLGGEGVGPSKLVLRVRLPNLDSNVDEVWEVTRK